MDVGRDQCADRERVLDDRQRAAGVGAVDLEDDADTRGEPAASTLAGKDDLDTGCGPADGLARHGSSSIVELVEQRRTLNLMVGDVNIE